MTCALLQHVKKNRDPRWEDEFQFTVPEPPINDKLHVEVVSTSSRIGLLHPKVHTMYSSPIIYQSVREWSHHSPVSWTVLSFFVIVDMMV